MPGTGTRAFIDPDHYEASLCQAQIVASITPRSAFKARLTWAKLCYMLLLRGEEELPRIGYIRLPPQLVFVAFMHSGEMPIWCGTRLPPGGVIVHEDSERFHQATFGPTGWSMLAIDRERLLRVAQSLLGRPLTLPARTLLLLPSTYRAAQLRRVHMQVCRLAETKPKTLTHPEVARALEQGLIQVLVALLDQAKQEEGAMAATRCAQIMERFEQVMTAHPDRPPAMPELCTSIGVSEKMLRACCRQILGIGPVRYIQLRRLKAVHLALRDSDPDMAEVAGLAARYGFAEQKRFARVYGSVFGESPLTTLHRAPVILPAPSELLPNLHSCRG